ncbi:MAG: hypothetical protein U1C74_24835 [Phenylobacterium sp.]|nr:hypothetical protein [Phenylobacterium sp.]
MTTMAMAQAVFQHAHDFYDTGSWYVVAECWDVLAIAEELDRQEERSATPFELEAAAIAHFHFCSVTARAPATDQAARRLRAPRLAPCRTGAEQTPSPRCQRSSTYRPLGLVIRSEPPPWGRC